MSPLEHLIRANKADKEREREIANIYRLMMGGIIISSIAGVISVIKTAIESKEISRKVNDL